MFGEECWLKTEQDITCRLYGCQHVGQEIVFLNGIKLPGRALFCKRHAAQIASKELHIAGVVQPAK